MKKHTLEYGMMLENNRLKNSNLKTSAGSTKDKFPVILDGGKTVIYISDKSKEAETREKYQLQRDSRIHPYPAKNAS